MSTFQERVQERAYFLWQNTGNCDSQVNWDQAYQAQMEVESNDSSNSNNSNDTLCCDTTKAYVDYDYSNEDMPDLISSESDTTDGSSSSMEDD